MILFPSSRILQSEERPVAIGSTVTAEGQALVADTTGGVFGVKPSTGGAGEKFMGVSLAQQLTLLYVPNIESLVQGVANTITLAHTPAAGTLRLVNATSTTLQTVGNPGTTANQYSISGLVITLNAAQVGNTYTATYRFSPTTVEARSIQGDIPAGGAAALTLGSVGVVKQGEIVTTEFDTTVDWTAANIVVTLGAGGLFTIGGAGAVTGAVVVEVPSLTSPYLGLSFVAQ